ncbi:MAG: queuosine precursor transporter [Tatlockia sp.]|nr:queuosine precursor transporter [Tatlockia sp.]
MDGYSRKRQYKYPYFLLGLYIIFLLSTVSLAGRITQVGSMLVPGGIFVFPLTFCICDIVGEVYGYAYPRLFIWIGVLAELVFSLILITVSHLPAPQFFHHTEAYEIVFDPTIRYVGAGLAGLVVGEVTNIYLLAKWKIFLKGKFFIFRSLLSTAFGQALLTVIVDILNYLGKMTDHSLGWMMVCGYFWKMCSALVMAFPAWLVVRYLKKVEHVDHYDFHTNFNPFLLSLDDKKISNTNPVNIESSLQ